MLASIPAPLAFADGKGQEIDKFNRFVQASTTSDTASSRLFLEGRTLIANRKWSEAAKKFNQIIKDYPRSENVDVALYWLAYSLSEQQNYVEAEKTLERILKEYPNSSWADDARAKHIEVSAALGKSDEVQNEAANSKDEIRIVALQSLFQADRQRGIAQASEILKRGSNASARLKEVTVDLLGYYGGKDATPLLVEIARSEQDVKLRKKAIYSLAWKDDESVANLLKEIVTNSNDDDLAKVALWALTQNSQNGSKYYAFFVQTAKSGKTIELRKQAIVSLFRLGSDQVVDELVGIYRANDDIEIRRAVIFALGSGGNFYGPLIAGYADAVSIGHGESVAGTIAVTPRAELMSTPEPPLPSRAVAPAATPPPGRGSNRAAVSSTSSSSSNTSTKLERAAAALIQLYDLEKDESLKASIVSALGRTGRKEATRKLMDIARSESSIVIKKRAIAALSQSNDPEVLTFLEELIK